MFPDQIGKAMTNASSFPQLVIPNTLAAGPGPGNTDARVLAAYAGAGIADHIHQHVVPRWSGDANFMPIIGKTKVMPKLLQESRQQLAAAWDQI